MMRAVPLILVLLLALGLSACGDDAPSSTLKGELRYVKSGGFAGDHVELVVQPDGSAALKSRRGGEREFTLSDAELESLADEAELVERATADAYSQEPAPDAFVYTITYEGARARTDDPNLRISGVASLIGELEKLLEAHG